MKKMKGFAAPAAAAAAAAMESSPSPYAAASLYEEARAMLKHQSLVQDYEDLFKETEAKKRKLHMMRQKRSTLLDEVRFLRRRFKYLTQNQNHKPIMGQTYSHPQNLVGRTKNVRKERNQSSNDSALRYLVPRFDFNQRGKMPNEQEAMLLSGIPIFDLNQKHKTYIGKEAALQNLVTIPDLNQKERIYSGKEATVRSSTPIFDLNQISREEEELQANGDMTRIEEPKLSAMRGGSEEQLNDMKLSACRNVGNGSSRAGKRKITWQDQVALRV